MSTVEEQKFTKSNHMFSNIIGINKNSNLDEYILLSAHIDSVKDIEGAIDSATSISIIIDIAKKIILKYPLNDYKEKEIHKKLLLLSSKTLHQLNTINNKFIRIIILMIMIINKI